MGELLTNARQEEAASRALERLEGAQAGLSAGVTPGRPAYRRGGGPLRPGGSSPAPPCGRTSPTGSSSVSALENKLRRGPSGPR